MEADILFWVALIGGIIGLPIAVYQLFEYIKKSRRPKTGQLVRLDVHPFSYFDGVIAGYRPDIPLIDFFQHKQVVSSENHLWMDVVNVNSSEQIYLAPFLLIRLVETKKVPDSACGIEFIGKGDGGTIRRVLLILNPEREGVFAAPLVKYWHGERSFPSDIDYFRLKRGEREVFEIIIEQFPGFAYRYQIGVVFRVAGSQVVKWSTETFASAMLNNPATIYEFDGSPYTDPEPMGSKVRRPFGYRPEAEIRDLWREVEQALIPHKDMLRSIAADAAKSP